MKNLNRRSSVAWRGIVSAVVGGTVLIGSGLVARADDVANTIDASVDSTAEAMNLRVGGPNGETQLRIVERNSDGKNGCNLTGSTKLVVSVDSANTAVATVSPSSVTFDSCGALKTLTVAPVGAGSTTVSLTETSNTTNGTFDLAPATFTVNVTAATPTDSTAPVITPAIAGTLGSNEWYTSDVTVSWTVGDNESSISSSTGCDQTTITTDTAGTTLTCTATSAGGTSSQSVTIKRDATPPTITGSRSPVANTNGWNNSDVTVSFSCADGLSGISSCDPSTTTLGEGADQSLTGTAVDKAGNSAEATVSNINIDKTAPTVALIGGPAAGGSYYFGFVPAAPTCSASDALSGLDGDCTVGAYPTAVGHHTVTATAGDKAGNTNSSSVSYTVLNWTLKGFYQPVDMNGVLNVVKGGSTVPMKFEVFAGSTELTDTSVVTSFTQTKIACDGSKPTDTIEVTDTGDTSLRYDATGGQFVRNWKTPTGAGTCYKVTMTTQDGSTLDAFFKLR